MKLSETDRDIIASIQLDANAPLPEIQRYAKHPIHVVRYAVKRLRDSQVIYYHPFINLFPLGFTQYTIFFSLSGQQRQIRNALLKFLVESEQVPWVGLLGGDYQFGVSVCVKTIRELSEFLDRLSSKFGNVFFEKSMAAIGNLTHFRMKYLSSKRGSRDFLSIVDSGDRLAIDETDHEILKSLSSGKASSLREIERETGIAHSTVEYRIKRLEANGVIIGYSYLVDTSVLGIQMYLLLLYVKAVEKSFKAALFDFCKTHRNVNFLIEYLGAWDYEVGVEVETSKEIISIIEDFYMRFGDVLNTIRVMQVFEYPKVSKYPFRSFEHLR